MRYFDQFDHRGSFKPVNELSKDELIQIRTGFAQLERTNVTFSVASSLFRGDYFEFGCLELHSFIRTLNACYIFDIENSIGDEKQYYGFDIFGQRHTNNPETRVRHEKHDEYFGNYPSDKSVDDYYEMIRENGIYADKCELIQGYFNETFTAEFVETYQQTGRRAGFVFVDCNIPESYAVVFNRLAEILRPDAWIYIDEYLEIPIVTAQFEKFRKKLEKEYGLGTVLASAAGGMGALFRCYPLSQELPD
jgi:hypothetical protein